MKIKSGVRILGICPEVLLAASIAESVYLKYSAEATITAGIDSKHSRASMHYAGRAIDLRINNVKQDQWSHLRQDLADSLGADFDVLLESDHIHVEYEPKEPYTA